jgi:hypothetical protein
LLKNKIILRFCFYLPVFTFICILISPDISYSQGRDRSKFQLVIDTSFAHRDTTKTIDTTRHYEPLDSTARLKYFKYERKDQLNPLFGIEKSSILLYNSSAIDYQLTFDSLDNVIISERVNSEEIKYPLKIPLDKYLAIRSDLEYKEQLYKVVADNYKIETGDELEKIFKNITDITIPLPFTSETIFGPPTLNFKVNGLIDITASYERTSSDQQTASFVSPTQNNINFKQEVQVTTKGTIGDKLSVDADWNSQRTFDYENQLHLKYTGYADEVIQSLEAGNVSLETKSNLIGSTQSLFGIKGQFKLGPLSLTAIASQKKSEKKEVNVTGGSQEITFEIPAYQYSTNHYFLDTYYDTSYKELYAHGSLVSSLTINNEVSPDIEVWVQTTPTNPQKRFAVCWIGLEQEPVNGYDSTKRSQDPPQIDGVKTSGWFVKLTPDQYTLQPQAGYITLNVNLPQNGLDAVAVAYRLAHNPAVHYGTYSSESNLVLKLVRFPNLQPPTQDTAQRTAWKLQIKSIYSVGVRNLKNDPSKLDLSIYYKPPGADNQTSITVPTPPNNALIQHTYLNLLGLDLRQNISYSIYTNSTGTTGDGQFDFFPGLTVDLANGEVIFPTLSPFYETLKQRNVPDSLIAVDTTIYSNSQTSAQNSTIKFYMGGKATGDASSRYSLGFNIVEGSVKVYNGPIQLAEGVDYTIDYSTGELVIRNASALSAGAQLKITYESNDLFQLASKTLLGTRAEYQFNKTSYLGFTLLNLVQNTLNDKVRIGEEPTNNTIMGFDASTDIKTNFLTNLVNKIPGYNTKEESILNLKGEVAYILPDPNTKKSQIPSDNGESVSYIDDFEGAKKVISLGLSPLSWTVASIPKDSTLLNPFPNNNTQFDTLISLHRCKMTWYNLINAVNVHDVYPNRQIGSNQSQTLTPLELDIYPFNPGMYTYADSSTFVDPNKYGPPDKKWAGIFKYLNTSITNLIDENIGFVQIWMKILNPLSLGDSAKMMIDLGLVSEKIIGNYRTQLLQAANSISTINTKNFFTEDLNSNGILDANEDNGITGLPLSMENQIFPHGSTDSVGYGNNPRNPSRDQYYWNQGSLDFTHFNGTRGNSALTEGRRIDGEDLNGNGVLDETDNYYEYAMPLTYDTTKNKYITGGGNNGWYQYSIPLNDFYKIFGSSGALTNVQYVRVWFKGITRTANLQIVEFDLVGNQWQKANKNDTSYSISSVNIEENSPYYQPPVPGDVLRQSDPTQANQTVLQNEQSISVEVRNLYQGQGKFATKFFNTKPFDLLNYKIVKLFVNNDPSFNYTDTGNYDAAMVIRLGSDSGNYYEYRAPLQKETRPRSPWNPLNEVTINLTDLTQVKQFRDSALTVPKYIPVPHGPPGSKYGVLGNPTISSITMISIGVVNNRKPISAHPISGTVWFDELRVLKTNDKSGYAYTFNAALKMADLGNLNFNFSKVDPNFHALEDRFGSLNLSTNWELSGTLNLHKILNSLMASMFSVKMKDFFNIPITFTHSETYDKPQFVPNSDIDLETAAQNEYTQVLAQTNGNQEYANYESNQLRIASQTLTINNRIAINGFKFTLPGDNFFVQELLNKMELSFYRNSSTQRSPTTQSSSAWETGGSLGINSNLKLMDIVHLNIGKYLPLGDEYKDAKLYFFFPFIPLVPLFTNSLGLGTNFVRSRGDEQLRYQVAANPTTRNFNDTRNMSLDWKFIENWIIDLTGNYTFNAGSDLTYLETTSDSLRQQRSNSQILNDIFFNGGSLINFGKDINYNQTININPKFNLPVIKNFLDLTSSYRVQYGWAPTLQAVNLGNTVSYNADFQASAYLKLKQILDLIKSGNSTNKMQGMSGSPMQNDNKQSLGDLFRMLGTFLPNQVSFSYGQNKIVTNGGVAGRAGFTNFWVSSRTKEDMGPSRAYQLGWINDPGHRVSNVATQDIEGYTNTLTMSAFINPIFPDNLKISFTYKTDWSRNKNSNYQTDLNGNLGPPTSVLGVRTITRPSFFYGTDIQSKLPIPTDPLTSADEISSAFEKNVVSFPFPSWDLNLTGIEKFEMFSSFASTISLETAYSSDYKKTLKFNGSIPEYIESQSIVSGYSPLLGVNVTFKEIQGGSLTASVKINKTNNFDVNPQSAVINITSTTDYSINTSYTKSGFKIPLFGLSLDNDLSIAFSYTRTTNDPKQLIFRIDQGFWDNSVLNGSISTSFNPSIQYALSKSVTVQLFYKYSKIEPNAGSQQIPTTTSNEAGLNLKLAIQ